MTDNELLDIFLRNKNNEDVYNLIEAVKAFKDKIEDLVAEIQEQADRIEDLSSQNSDLQHEISIHLDTILDLEEKLSPSE